MFEKLKKVNIKGGCFEEETTLELFKNDPVSVIYGRNGSGKSTIARGIKEYGKTPNVFFQSLFSSNAAKDDDKLEVTGDGQILKDKKDQVFVFNEDFVNEKVKMEGDGELPAIVMLGEQVEIDHHIKEKEEKLKKAKEEEAVLANQSKQYDDSDNPISLFNLRETISRELLKEDGYVDVLVAAGDDEKDKVITDVKIDIFLSMEEPTEEVGVLERRLKEDLDLLIHAEDTDSVTREEVVIYVQDDVKEVEALLKEPVDSPVLSEREKRLFTFIGDHRKEDTRQLINEKWEFCPHCLREITESDRELMAAKLSRMLTEKAAEYSNRLVFRMQMYEPIQTEWEPYPHNFYQQEVSEVRIALQELNSLIEIVKKALYRRNRDIYVAIEKPFEDGFCEKYAAAVKTLKVKISNLNQRLKVYNDKVQDLEWLQYTVVEDDNKWARKSISPLLETLRQALKDKERYSIAHSLKHDEVRELEREIAELKIRKKNTKIALDFINQELQYVFFSKKVRLELGEEGNYRLKVNGKFVKPNRISVGERNVLGLCYYFANLLGADTDKIDYGLERLIVIDDPVSSFDYGNRLGVMSLLRYQFGNILKGNQNSRILVMSHDLYSVFDLIKIKKELIRQCGSKYLVLENRQLKPVEFKHEYANQMQKVFNYAVDRSKDDPDETHDMGIGNTMRRMLEAFSTFCYCSGFEEVLHHEDLLTMIPADKRTYFANFMCRLALNGESHAEESTYALNSITPYFTHEEKVQTAKSLLLFLYYVNEPHLRAYLKEKADVVKSWKDEEWLVTT